MNTAQPRQHHPRLSVGDRVVAEHLPHRFAGVVGFGDGDRVKVRWEGTHYDAYRPYDTFPATLLRWPGESAEPSSVDPLTDELLTAAEQVRRDYEAFLGRAEQDTPTLEEYRDWCRFDDNLPWRLGHGAVVNLLEEALDRIDELTASTAGDAASTAAASNGQEVASPET